VHNLHAWFISVKAPGWNSHFDFGRYTFGMLRWVGEFRDGGSTIAVSLDIVAALLIVSVAAAAVVGLSRRVPVELRAWTCLTVLFILGSDNGWYAMPRYLLPLFPLLVPAAEVIARTSRRNQVITAAMVIVLSAWWGAFFLQTPGMGL
jgi:hypothetical protein